MRIEIINSDFEVGGDTNWDLSDIPLFTPNLAEINGDFDPFGGVLALELVTQSVGPEGRSFAKTINPIPVVSGRQYTLDLWIQLRNGGTKELTIHFDHGQFPTALESIATAGLINGEWFRREYVFTAQATQNGVLSFASDPVIPEELGLTRWIVDDIRLTDVATKQIFDAMILDLQDIDGTGIFTTTVLAVTENERTFADSKTPAIMASTGIGESETFAMRHNRTIQKFGLKLRSREANPGDTIRALLDDVRNSLERTGSNTLTVSAVTVTAVIVEEWTRINMASEQEDNWAEMDCLVSVTYTHAVGTA